MPLLLMLERRPQAAPKLPGSIFHGWFATISAVGRHC